MMIGELIDLLEPYRGRGDSVQVWDKLGGVFLVITGAEWDRVNQCFVIKTTPFRNPEVGV